MLQGGREPGCTAPSGAQAAGGQGQSRERSRCRPVSAGEPHPLPPSETPLPSCLGRVPSPLPSPPLPSPLLAGPWTLELTPDPARRSPERRPESGRALRRLAAPVCGDCVSVLRPHGHPSSTASCHEFPRPSAAPDTQGAGFGAFLEGLALNLLLPTLVCPTLPPGRSEPCHPMNAAPGVPAGGPGGHPVLAVWLPHSLGFPGAHLPQPLRGGCSPTSEGRQPRRARPARGHARPVAPAGLWPGGLPPPSSHSSSLRRGFRRPWEGCRAWTRSDEFRNAPPPGSSAGTA